MFVYGSTIIARPWYRLSWSNSPAHGETRAVSLGLSIRYGDALPTFLLLALAGPQDIDATVRANNIDLGRIVEAGLLSTMDFFANYRLRPIGLDFDVEDKKFFSIWFQEERIPP
jgi:hypothetical protein